VSFSVFVSETDTVVIWLGLDHHGLRAFCLVCQQLLGGVSPGKVASSYVHVS